MDFRGYALGHDFIFKEIAVLCSEGRCVQVWTLRPPCGWSSLSVEDQQRVRKSTFGLAWDDGEVHYRSMEGVFVTLAREFRTWVVESDEKKELAYPYKSMSVSIEVRPLKKDVERVPKIRCVYDHDDCAVSTVTEMYNESK